jgi:hypothetical protein
VKIRWLSMLETAVRLGVGWKSVKGMLTRGQLEGVKTPAGWRVLYPSGPLAAGIARTMQAPDDIYLLRGVEAAGLLGISSRGLRKMADEGRIKSRWVGKRRFYSVQAVRDALARRHNGNKLPSPRRKSLIIVTWATCRLRGIPIEAVGYVPDGTPLHSV